MIQDKIEQARHRTAYTKEVKDVDNHSGHKWPVTEGVDVYSFTKPELLSLLREVAAEQRELCQKELDSGNPKVRNAPYPEPLNEDSDE